MIVIIMMLEPSTISQKSYVMIMVKTLVWTNVLGSYNDSDLDDGGWCPDSSRIGEKRSQTGYFFEPAFAPISRHNQRFESALGHHITITAAVCCMVSRGVGSVVG